jgi:hypothetical protein
MYPAGVYGVWSPGNGSLAPMAAVKGVVGVFANLPWFSLEPVQGQYVIGPLLTMLGEAEAAGMAVRLSVDASAYHAPQYVKDGSRQIGMIDTVQYRTTYGQKLFGPVFWDPFYLQRKAALFRFIASQLSFHRSLIAVGVPHPCWQTSDVNIPHAVGTWNGHFQDQPSDWLAAGYTHDGMVAAGSADLDMTAGAFPNASPVQAMHPTHPALDGHLCSLAADLTAYGYGAYPGRYVVECDDLSAATPDAAAVSQSIDDPTFVYSVIAGHGAAGAAGWQLISAANDASGDNSRLNGGTPGDPATVLRRVFDIGLSYRPRFIELWWNDATDPALASVIAYGTERMGGAIRS